MVLHHGTGVMCLKQTSGGWCHITVLESCALNRRPEGSITSRYWSRVTLLQIPLSVPQKPRTLMHSIRKDRRLPSSLFAFSLSLSLSLSLRPPLPLSLSLSLSPSLFLPLSPPSLPLTPPLSLSPPLSPHPLYFFILFLISKKRLE